MQHVSRPLIGLLVATVAVFALWFVELRPSSSGGSGGSNPGVGAYQADINAAHKAVTTANDASARAGGETTPATAATTPLVTTAKSPSATRHAPSATRHAPSATRHAPSATRHAPSATRTATAHPATPAGRLAAVEGAMHAGKVVVLLFYNPSAADDQAVKQELAAVPAGRRLFKLAIPVGEVASYTAITSEVPVNFAPTLVVIAPDGRAEEIAGFADSFEISQRVAQAEALAR